MSEQTPDTESGLAEGQDPSMEDILASIRKIIAEDDGQAATAPDTLMPEVVADVPSPSGDISDLGHVETLDLDILADEPTPIDPDIDALIGDMDASASDAVAPTIAPLTSEAVDPLDDILDLEIPLDEPEIVTELAIPEVETEIEVLETETLALEDELIDLVAEPEAEKVLESVEETPKAGLMDGALAAMGLGGAAAIGTANHSEPEPVEPEPVASSEVDELSLMLDNMLEDNASYEESPAALTEERVIDPAADLISDDLSGEDILAELDLVEDMPEPAAVTDVMSRTDPDIDLVKSLMADLTEAPLHDEVESYEIAAETIVPALEDAVEPSTDDIMDEILSITLDDETKLSEEAAPIDFSTPITEDIPSKGLSLKEIAAAAEADAKASEAAVAASTAAVAGLAAAATVTAAAATPVDESLDIEPIENEAEGFDEILSQVEELVVEEDLAEAETITPEPITPEFITEETPEMPRAKKTDAIIDEVTETATAGAFASLNQVVEEKATVAERGDRIGDLVMEALQPMLKEWLDANLKGIVERAVTKEVKRISSGK